MSRRALSHMKTPFTNNFFTSTVPWLTADVSRAGDSMSTLRRHATQVAIVATPIVYFIVETAPYLRR